MTKPTLPVAEPVEGAEPSAGQIEEWRDKAADYDRLAGIARNRRMVLEEIAGLKNLTATDKQFWQALQRLATKAVNDYTFQGDYEDHPAPQSAWQISERMPSHHRQRTSLENINDVLEVLYHPAPASAQAGAVPEEVREWISEALSYVGCQAWSPSMVREGKRLLDRLAAPKAGAGESK